MIKVPVGPLTSRRYGLRIPQCWGRPVGSHRWQREFYWVESKVPVLGTRIEGIRVRKWYNFGNMVRQILNVISFCDHVGVRVAAVPSTPWFRSGRIRNIEFTSGEVPSGRLLVGTFFYPEIVGIEWDAEERAETLSSLAGFLLLGSRHGRARFSDSLVIHLRSGDVFSGDPHPDYWPPPLGYFIASIEASRRGHVHVVAQDLDHPYIDHLRTWCEGNDIRFTVQCSSLSEDLGVLLTAEALCLSQGTMGLAAAWLNEGVKEVYIFGDQETAELRALGKHVRAVESREGVPRGAWYGTTEQIRNLLGQTADSMSVKVLD